MLTRLVLLLACAVSFAVVPSASASDPALVVRGTRSGYVDVTFPAPFTVDPFFTVTTYRKGRYAGFWAERIGAAYSATSDQFGYVAIGTGGATAYARTEKGKQPGATSNVPYTAGRYRIHVLADGPFEVVVPVNGLTRSILATPRRAVAAPRFLSAAATPSAAGTVWDAREHVRVGGARVAALSVSYVTWDTAGMHDDLLCFVAPGQDCGAATVTQSTAQLGTGEGQHGTGTVLAGPGTLAAGSWDAVQRVVAAPGATFTAMHGYALVFDAPAG